MKINTAEDILKWAEMVVAAKGEKFTPLSKGDQYLIAQYILESSADTSAKAKRNENAVKEPPTQEAKEGEENRTKNADGTAMEATAQEVQQAERIIHMARGSAYHCKGFSPQQVYDKYLEWLKTHQTEGAVMDFSTGKKSDSAAFAYWLAEVISVHVVGDGKGNAI